MTGEVYRVKKEAASNRADALTCREHEILALLCEGLSNREIAGRLSISQVTVRHHLSAIFYKLGVSSRIKLVVYAFKNGLVDLPQ